MWKTRIFEKFLVSHPLNYSKASLLPHRYLYHSVSSVKFSIFVELLSATQIRTVNNFWCALSSHLSWPFSQVHVCFPLPEIGPDKFPNRSSSSIFGFSTKIRYFQIKDQSRILASSNRPVSIFASLIFLIFFVDRILHLNINTFY